MSSASRSAVLALLLLACSKKEPPLDGMGKMMVDPIRLDVMQPAAIVAKMGLRPTDVVADIGAGPGAFTHEIARAVPRGRVIATDIGNAYLERIMKDASDHGEKNVEARLVGRDDNGLRDGEIDVAFLCQVDHYLHDRRDYFTRLARALKPGGRVVIVNYLREEKTIDSIFAELGWREVSRWQPVDGFFARAFVHPEAR